MTLTTSPTRHRLLALVALVPLLALLAPGTGCGRPDRLTIGSKTFTEGLILGEMIAVLAEQQGIPVDRQIPWGNSFDCQQGIKQGDIDVYVEYNGTGMSMMGLPAVRDGDEAQEKVRDLFEPLGLHWGERIGFDNSYILVMRPDRAAAHEIETISDLTKLGRPVRFGCTPEYVARPVDGLTPLLQRYGLTGSGDPVTASDRDAVYRAVLDGRVDVAIGFATDGQITEFALQELDDNLGFFPAYEAAPLVRQDALERFPQLQAVLEQLAGMIDAPTMRALNKQVALDGADPAWVVRAFLAEKGLVEAETERRIEHKLVLAVPPGTARTRLVSLALRAVRKANPSRRVELREVPDIREAVGEGEAFIGLASAERFFALPEPGKLPARADDIEAVAVVGYHVAHLVVPADAGTVSADESPFAGIETLGAGPDGGASERAARLLLDAWGKGGESGVTVEAGMPDDQFAALREGQLDGVLLMVEPGDPRITEALRDHELTLRPLSGWTEDDRQFRFAFLRSARIAAGTYAGLDQPIDTVRSQVVLVGPAPVEAGFGDGGPVGAMGAMRAAIPDSMKHQFRELLGTRETIDPTLPGRTVGLATEVQRTEPINPDPAVSVLTLFFLGLFAWLISVMFRPDKAAV